MFMSLRNAYTSMKAIARLVNMFCKDLQTDLKINMGDVHTKLIKKQCVILLELCFDLIIVNCVCNNVNRSSKNNNSDTVMTQLPGLIYVYWCVHSCMRVRVCGCVHVWTSPAFILIQPYRVPVTWCQAVHAG